MEIMALKACVMYWKQTQSFLTFILVVRIADEIPENLLLISYLLGNETLELGLMVSMHYVDCSKRTLQSWKLILVVKNKTRFHESLN